ncbi:ATP-binding protein [Pseudomonas sp. NPDC086278]|uniref:hybrid sensor histidine kinase/response regulator n=1 Tax=Pseudomonas sp. NPDC086278 TaxID=3390646 RepID=UPI003D0045FF
MKMDTAFGALALSSLRISTGFLLMAGLVLLLTAATFWAMLRLFDDQEVRADSHFQHVMDNIHEQQAFLQRVSDKMLHPDEDLAREPNVLTRKLMLHSDGMDIYQASERSYSLPFTLAQSEQVSGHELDLMFDMGWHLTNAFSRFWAGSRYQSPQIMLFSPDSRLTIAVPAIGELREQPIPSLANFVRASEDIFKRVNADPQTLTDRQVHWVSSGTGSQAMNHQMIVYVGASIPFDRFRQESGIQDVVVSSVFDLDRLRDDRRQSDIPDFDQLTLIGPGGNVLIGEKVGPSVAQPGLSLSKNGLWVTRFARNTAGEQWTAHYFLGYENFFLWAKWPLLRLLIVCLSVIVAGWWAYHLYRTRVVMPAKRAHQQLLESQAFSRAIIDIAPAGLSVVRLNDNHIVLENQRAKNNRDVTEAIVKLLDADIAAGVCIAVAERYYFVSYTQTRFQDENVLLCVFSDVTQQHLDFNALREAKAKADQANNAKSVFLATMSHEIRTPLYGVLGTLELMGLTHLDQRQRDYLHVIQRSSTTLLQLISDVLDVSKIEAGQLSLEPVSFCPLHLAEDALSAHVANAVAKGLQIYACIDADMPDLLYGDQMRIWQILNNLLSNAIKFTDIGRIVLRGRVLKEEQEQVLIEFQVTDTGIGISQEQQLHLFDPFYQVRSNNLAGGTGLGLSICYRFAELMGGEVRVVSEPGLGSSFSVMLTLRKVIGGLPDDPEIDLDNIATYVRAPVRELADNISDWLNRWGANAQVVTDTAQHSAPGALLVDVLGSSHRSIEWRGERLICDADGPLLPEYSEQGWRVGAHHIGAIAKGVLMSQQASPVESQMIENERSPKLGLRILVAEDNPINQGILKEQLEEIGCFVTLASDGQQALQAWESGTFDVVLTDVNMPFLNGYQLTEALRKAGVEIPIIGVTANAMREEGERCRAAGMTSWMVKPLSLSTLRERLLKTSLPDDIQAPVVTASSVKAKGYTPEPIALSAGMRSLFLSTMRQDIAATRSAMVDHDPQRVREKLHGLCGALAVVQASELSSVFGLLEHRVNEQKLTASLGDDVDEALQWLSNLLQSQDASASAE